MKSASASRHSPSMTTRRRYLPRSTSLLAGKVGPYDRMEAAISTAKDHPTTTIPPAFFSG